MGMRPRRACCGALILAMLTAGAAPAPAQTAPGATGTARTTLTLPEVGGLELGGLRTDVGTRGTRRAAAGVDLLGAETITADLENPAPPDTTVELPGGIGSVGIAGVGAADDGTEAGARIASVMADVEADPLDLLLGAGTGSESTVGGTAAVARDVVEVETLSVRLREVLGEEVLDGLDLDALLDLAEGLGAALELGEDAGTDLQALLDLREGLGAGVNGGALDGLVAALGDVDLNLFREDLVAGIGESEVLGVEELTAAVAAEATATTSSADVVCELGELRLLGAPVAPDGTCEGLAAAVTELDPLLTDLLDGLPGAQDDGDLVTVDGGDVFATVDDAHRGGLLVGEARLAGPSVEVTGLDLLAPEEGGLADQLAALNGGGLLDDLGLLPDGAALDGVAIEGLSLSTVQVGAATTFGGSSAAVVSAGECEEAPAEDGDPVVRIEAAGRVATSVAVSACAFAAADVALLARSDVYADALTGSSLISLEPAPLLLTPSSALAPEVRGELERLGVSRVIMLGGQVALRPAVESELRDMDLEVQRIGGLNRFHTAARIAAELGAGATDAYIVEGRDADPLRGWPDAVSVAPLAAHTGRPVLLVDTDDVPAWTAEALRDLDVERTTIVGGTAAVGEGVEDELRDDGYETVRIAGQNRFHTSAEVHEEKLEAGMDRAMLYLVSGNDWPDALVTGAAVASLGHTMHLVHHEDLDLSPHSLATLTSHAGALRAVRIIGGSDTISAEVEADLRAALAAER